MFVCGATFLIEDVRLIIGGCQVNNNSVQQDRQLAASALPLANIPETVNPEPDVSVEFPTK
jgi:hypothetical protein